MDNINKYIFENGNADYKTDFILSLQFHRTISMSPDIFLSWDLQKIKVLGKGSKRKC
jgi:hypothetical protein